MIPRKLVEGALWVLASLSIFLIVLSCAVFTGRSGWVSYGLTTVKLANIRPDGGFGYIAPTHHPELSERHELSSGIVLENGVPLAGEPGAGHDAIRKLGMGRTSFWDDNVYFASSDNSPPPLNGRSYEIRYPRYATNPVAYAIYAATLILFAGSVWLASAVPGVTAKIRRAAAVSAVPLFFAVLSLSLISSVLFGAAILSRQGALSLGWRIEPLAKVQPESGYAYIAPTHHPELSVESPTSSGFVLENGVPLPGPGDASHEEIREKGLGSYSFWADTVHFSATDNSSPLSNRRLYAIRYPRAMPRALELTALIIAVLSLFAAGCLGYNTLPIRSSIERFISFSFGFQFYSLGLVTALSIALSLAAYANRRGWTSLGWRTDVLLHIHPEAGFAFKAPTFHPELSAEQRPSRGIVLEDGVPFPQALNASHDTIRDLGGGRFSFWRATVYFSASDNSAPNRNGRSYSIQYPRSIGAIEACLSYALTLLLSGCFVWYTIKIPVVVRSIDRVMLKAIAAPYFVLILVTGLCFGLSYTAYMNHHGMFSLGWKTVALNSFRPEGGFAYSAPTDNSELGPAIDGSAMSILENGVPLPGPAESRHDDIRQRGHGRYSFWGDNIYFAATDNTDPRVNGRSYQAHYPTMVNRPVRLALYAITILSLAASIIYGKESKEIRSALAAVKSILEGPLSRVLPTLSLCLLLLSATACLNQAGAIAFGWRTAPLTNIQHEAGFAYVAATRHSELGYEYLPSPGQLLQDGAPLPAGVDARLEDVRKSGKGRYQFLGEQVYFSAPDNSVPGANGRSYAIRYPRVLDPAFTFLLSTATAIVIAGTILSMAYSGQHRPRLAALLLLLRRPPFYLPAGILLLFFLIPRLPFFIHFPVVDIEVDSGSYLTLVALLRGHYWLYFDIRTPGYPLFVWPFTYIPNHWLIIVIFQCLLTLTASAFLVLGIYRLRSTLALPASIAMGAFLAGSQVVMYDTAILSESLYTSVIIFSVAFLILGLTRPSPTFLILSSAAMAYAILIRPAGMYLIVIYLLVLIYLLWNRYRLKIVISYFTPFPAILLLLCSYNYYTIRSFLISPFGETNLAGATILYWEPDPSLPDEINAALKDLPNAYAKAGMSENDFDILRHSWDPEKLIEVFNKQYNQLVWIAGYGSGKRFGHKGYLYYRPYIRQVSLAAIKKHPIFYIKYVWTNLSSFFGNIDYHYEFYAQLASRAKEEFVEHSTAYTIIPSEDTHTEPTLPSAIHLVESGSDTVIAFDPTFLGRLHVAWERIHWEIFLCTFWIWAYLFIFAASVIKLFSAKGHHLGAFVLVMLSLVMLGASLVVALVEIAMNRYSYPTQFVFYLMVAVWPLLLNGKIRPIAPVGFGNASVADESITVSTQDAAQM